MPAGTPKTKLSNKKKIILFIDDLINSIDPNLNYLLYAENLVLYYADTNCENAQKVINEALQKLNA